MERAERKSLGPLLMVEGVLRGAHGEDVRSGPDGEKGHKFRSRTEGAISRVRDESASTRNDRSKGRPPSKAQMRLP
jgi:hypothetical protein